MALKRIEESLCTGCRVCIESCPMDCIRFNEETGKAYPAFPGDCQVCLLCQHDCPAGAIIITAERARSIPLPW
jgi:NAD-dependent dihydropyrimidine dehydrogenase PreA subunit